MFSWDICSFELKWHACELTRSDVAKRLDPCKQQRLNIFRCRIIATLEKLKEEAAEITRKVEETDVVMAEVEAVSDQYGALSHYCSSIYFTMEGLNLVSKTANQ